MNSTKSLLVKRRQIGAFIREDPQVVQMVRRSETATSAGGVKLTAPVELAYQVIRLVPPSGRGGPNSQQSETSLGNVEAADRTLIGVHTADVQKGDEFEASGVWYRVISVDEDRSYRLAAGVVQHGSA